MRLIGLKQRNEQIATRTFSNCIRSASAQFQ